MPEAFHPSLPSIALLRERARRRLPRFAFEYLDGGCVAEDNLRRNTEDLKLITLRPHYLRDFPGVSLETPLFGRTWAAPFGVAPVGLQGLMWPRSAEILARAAARRNIPFVLSTVTTASIESIAAITEGQAWFQLYHPAEDELRDALVERAKQAGLRVLVVLADTPSFGYRPKEIKNGLSIPPRMTAANVLEMALHPRWCAAQLLAGRPEFATMKPYLPDGLDLKHLGQFMNATFRGRLTEDKLAALRDRWPGTLVVKGLVTEADVDLALRIGVDGFIVSNHGGRQHDAGASAIEDLDRLAPKYRDQTTVMMDGGIRSGPDIARAMACGAHFTFLGRAFMYGVAALGEAGGEHTIELLDRQLRQAMEQVGCASPQNLTEHLDGAPVRGRRSLGASGCLDPISSWPPPPGARCTDR